jgi:hypothetical protein
VTDNVIDIADRDPHFVAQAICLKCKWKWIAVVHCDCSLFTLECSKCGALDSFGSYIPDYVLEARRKH